MIRSDPPDRQVLTEMVRRARKPSADGTRDSILTAALDVFSERGFEAAPTREIAARAGVTQPLLNYHFSSKDELWRAAVDGLFTRLSDCLSDRARGLRGVDASTTARLLVREFILFSAHNPEVHRIITQECKSDGPRMDWLVDHHIRRLYDETAKMFASAGAHGFLAAVPPAHLYYILTGAGATMFVLAPECRRLTGLDPTSDDVIQAHADAVCLLLFGPAAGDDRIR